MKKTESGEISLVDGTVIYRINGDGWSIPLSDVRVIGEYTTANGPYVDDYFFVFLTATKNGWHQASFYAEGRDAFLSALGKALGTTIETGLCNSTHWKTRILWPPAIMGEPLMRTVPKPTRWGRFWEKISGSQDVVLSDAARSIFNTGKGAEPSAGPYGSPAAGSPSGQP